MIEKEEKRTVMSSTAHIYISLILLVFHETYVSLILCETSDTDT